LRFRLPLRGRGPWGACPFPAPAAPGDEPEPDADDADEDPDADGDEGEREVDFGAPEDFAAEPPVVAPEGLSFTAVPAPAPPPAPAPLLEPGRIGPLRLLRAFGGMGARLPWPCPEAATLMAVLRLAASTAE
jgi:hypothetical protein